MAIWPTSIATDADLYVALDNFSTTLNGAITNSQTTITLTSVIGLPTAGILTIESEKIKYTGISVNDITGVTRGFSSTTAAAHANATTVSFFVVEEHHNANKDEIIAIETSLNFTASRALRSDSLGRAAVSSTTDTELGYLGGVTSALQTQLNAKAPAASPTFTGQALFADGTAALPSISFSADNDVGFYRQAANSLDVSIGGIAQWRFNTAGFIPLDTAQTIYINNGTAALPSLAFNGDPDTGISYGGTNTLTISSGGQSVIQVQPAAVFLGDADTIVRLGYNGTAATPVLTWDADSDTGIYRIGTNSFGLVSGGIDVLTVQTTAIFVGNQTVRLGQDGTGAAPVLTWDADSDIGMFRSAPNVLGLAVPTGGSIGLFVNSSARVTLSISNLNPAGAANLDLGDATNYWNEVNYKTLTDRGCLPWCDDGVELCDGSHVSDLDALCAIQKHPTDLTIHGLPKLDYRTFPKKSYRPADKNGILVGRDENGSPIEGADGVEMTMMFGVMIGAFKQLKQENEALKARILALENLA